MGVSALRLTLGERDGRGERGFCLRHRYGLRFGVIIGEGVFIRTGNRVAFYGVVNGEV